MANAITIMRKKINDKKWLLKRQESLLEESFKWHRFLTFDCSEFFRGSLVAKHNLVLYEKNAKRIVRQLNFIKGLIKKVH